MDFTLSEDQTMLRAMIARLLADHRDAPEAVLWPLLAEMGLLGLPFDPEDGGLGLGPVEIAIVAEEMGRAQVTGGWLPAMVMAGTALRLGADAAQRARLIPALIAGDLRPALALGEVTARLHGTEWRLSGAAPLCLGGDMADILIVVTTDDRLFLVPATAEGLSRRCYALHGGGGAADIILCNVLADGLADAAAPLVAAALEAASAAMAAEAVGAMAAVLDLTLDHLRTRHQFGKPLAANQVLQHRAADMLVELEQARSAALFAAMALDQPDAAARARNLGMARTVIARAGRFVGQWGVQLHGGLGVSEEHAVGRHFRRLTAIALLFLAWNDPDDRKRDDPSDGR